MHIDETLQEIRDFLEVERITPCRLFRMAGLNIKSSHVMYREAWNPTASTIRKLQDAIRAYRLGRE